MTSPQQRAAGLHLAPIDGTDKAREIDHVGAQRAARDLLPALGGELEPKGVGVVVEAEHLCMSLRGVQKLGAKTVTSALHGLVRDDARTRGELLALTTRTSHDC